LEASANPEPAAEEHMMANPVFLVSSLWESQKEIVLAGGKTVIAWVPEQKSVVVNFSGTSQINKVICSLSFIGPLPYSEPYPACVEKEDLEILHKVGKQMVDQSEKSFLLKKFIYSQIQSCRLWWRTKVEFWRSNLVQNRTRMFSKEKSCCFFCKMVRTHRWKSFKQHAKIEEKNICNKYGVLIKKGYHIPYPGCWSLLSKGVRNSSEELIGNHYDAAIISKSLGVPPKNQLEKMFLDLKRNLDIVHANKDKASTAVKRFIEKENRDVGIGQKFAERKENIRKFDEEDDWRKRNDLLFEERCDEIEKEIIYNKDRVGGGRDHTNSSDGLVSSVLHRQFLNKDLPNLAIQSLVTRDSFLRKKAYEVELDYNSDCSDDECDDDMEEKRKYAKTLREKPNNMMPTSKGPARVDDAGKQNRGGFTNKYGIDIPRKAERQSGVKGVTWHKKQVGWVVRYSDKSLGKNTRALPGHGGYNRGCKFFGVNKYVDERLGNWEQAIGDALKEAIKFRKEMEGKDGIEKKESNSGYEGVGWHKGVRVWQARVCVTMNGKQKWIGKAFNPKKFPSSEDAKQAAIEWRKSELLRLKGETANTSFKDNKKVEETKKKAEEARKEIKRESGHVGIDWKGVGWRVRHNPTQTEQIFYLKAYQGSIEDTLAAAVALRNKKEQTKKTKVYETREVTGVVGVTWCERDKAYTAAIGTCGRGKDGESQYFAVSKYNGSKEDAKKAAAAWRKQKEQELIEKEKQAASRGKIKSTAMFTNFQWILKNNEDDMAKRVKQQEEEKKRNN